MYAAEVLGKFSVYRESAPLSVSMALTQCLRNFILISPLTGHINTHVISGRAPMSPMMMRYHCSMDAKSVGGDVFSVMSSSKSDVDYLEESTKGDFNLKLEHLQGIDGQASLEGPIEEVAQVEAQEAEVVFVTFLLSSVLDNMTSTIVMVSLLRKLVPPS